MNYLVACDRLFEDAPSGGARVAWELAQLARNQGCRVGMLCAATTEATVGPTDHQGIRVVRYPLPQLPKAHPLRLRRHLEAARLSARRWLSEWEWDVVHSHMLVPGMASFEECGRSALRICTVHSPVVLEEALNWNDGTIAGAIKIGFGLPLIYHLERGHYRKAHRLSTLSTYTAATLQRLYGRWVAPKIRTIPWWSDASQAAGSKSEARGLLGWESETPTFFTLRRLVRRMGLDLFIAALHSLAAKGLKFVAYIAGDGPERTALASQAASGPAQRQIVFMGSISEDAARLAYQAADLFVLPTRSLECFGIITVEALSYGCPVIGTRVGAIPETLGPLCGGLLFAPNAKALSCKLADFLDRTLIVPSASTIRTYVCERYSKDAILGQYLDLLSSGNAEHAE